MFAAETGCGSGFGGEEADNDLAGGVGSLLDDELKRVINGVLIYGVGFKGHVPVACGNGYDGAITIPDRDNDVIGVAFDDPEFFGHVMSP